MDRPALSVDRSKLVALARNEHVFLALESADELTVSGGGGGRKSVAGTDAVLPDINLESFR